MSAFITGSRAYGHPTVDSDLDLVVLMSEEDCALLCRFSGVQVGDVDGYPNNGYSIRVGGLNLLVVTDAVDYQNWVEGTQIIKARAPVLRSHAEGIGDGLRRLGMKIRGAKVPVTIPLIELVRIAGTRNLWPADFEGKIVVLEDNYSEKTAWGVIADYLDEIEEPVLADAFRWVFKRPSVFIKNNGNFGWRFDGLPVSVSTYWTTYGYDTRTIPGAVACLANALSKLRDDAE